MSLSPLTALAGTAALSLAGEAVAAVGSGLSFAAQLLRGDEPAVEPVPAEDPDTQEFATALDQFLARVRQELAAAGLKLTGAVQIQSDGLFGVQAQGSADDESLERLFAASESLREQFNQLAERHEDLTGKSRHEFGLLLEGEAASVLA